MRRILSLPVACLLSLTALTACDRSVTTAPLPEAPDASASAHADARGAPVAVPFEATIPDDDPCTAVVDPEEHRVTFAGTSYIQELPNGDAVIRTDYTITTDSGYKGSGHRREVFADSIYRGHFNDMVFHPDGRQFRAHAVQVVDLKTDPPTIRVLEIHPLTCIRT